MLYWIGMCILCGGVGGDARGVDGAVVGGGSGGGGASGGGASIRTPNHPAPPTRRSAHPAINNGVQA